ncbi:MAG: DUF421 domain-containing protein [Thermoproteota archaeon]|nr:DUF421 domain-containing protein [Thermoproteota archaeon]
MFFVVLIIIRWMGKKGFGELTMFKLLIVVGLGSAIGDPMIYQQNMSIPQGLAAIVIVVILFKITDILTIRSKRFKRVTISPPVLLVENGKFIEEGFENAKIEKEEYFSHMRIQGIEDISQVRKSYLEINRQISFIQKKQEQ